MKNMKDLCKRFFKREFRKARFVLGFTQERMSEILCISARSYSDLENGKYMCSAMVLILFIIYCDIDVVEFFDELKEIIENRE